MPVDTNGTGQVLSENGQLVMKSGTNDQDYGKLYARRHPTYQANRGHLYSTALILPEPEKVGFTRKWGMYFTDYSSFQSGVFFELTDGILYGKIISTFNGELKEKSIVLDYSGFDIGQGTLFDIRFQWRGVGDYFFFIDEKLVGTILGEQTEKRVSMINPSLPPRFECINNGGAGEVELICGCVDITSEGGQNPRLNPSFVETVKNVSIPTTATPVIILYVPHDFKNQHNTRDTRIEKATLGCDRKSVIRIISTRDKSIFGNAALDDIDGEADFTWVGTTSTVTPGEVAVKYFTGASELDLTDPTKYKLAGGGYISKDGDNIELNAADYKDIELVMTHGDYVILVGEAVQQAGDGYGTFSLGEEI